MFKKLSLLKQILIVGAVVLIAGGGYLLDVARAGQFPKFEFSVCDTPIYYKIGEVDDKFGVKKEKLLSGANRAAQIWNKAVGRDLFLYKMEDSENNALTINFKYDKRQALTTQINQLEGRVFKDENSLKAAIADYETKVADLNTRLQKFNAEVQEWNEKGGAPPEVYDRLRAQQASLQDEAGSLAALAQELNLSVEKYNSQIGRLNTTIETFNDELSRRPEEGLFDANQNKIEIFFFADQTELVHTLAHEFGHARGLEHINDEEAIMFPYTTDVLKLDDKDLEQLKAICRERNVLDETKVLIRTIVDRYKLLFEKYKLPLDQP